jgi:hypothetical protein
MNAVLVALLLLVSGGIVFLAPSKAPAALVIAAALSGMAIILINRIESDRRFLLQVFMGGLLVRFIVGTIIFVFNFQDFFGGDADTYDQNGFFMQQGWHGNKYYAALPERFIQSGAGAWGMLYLVAGIYEIVGRNPLAVQFVNAVLGAATAAVIFLCAFHIFGNNRVARLAGLLTAFFPSLVLWSSQELKDGPIVFALALSILATLKLGERFTVKYFTVLTVSLFALLSLRSYIFYMMVAAVVGAFVIGMRKVTAQSFVRQFLIIVGIGLAMTWIGVIRSANVQFAQFGNLEAVQRSRSDAARSAKSGFAPDVDVSTTEGALSAVPVGLLYLLFAPFPWQLSSLRQTITLPEMIVWWAAFPMLIVGLWFAIRYKLRQISPILIFTVMLTLAYSVFQGNVGTAYRQRAQLVVFYFIFVAVGVILLKEKQEERAQRNREATLEALERRRRWRVPRNQPSVPIIKDEGEGAKA